jgi:hypothetical protein
LTWIEGFPEEYVENQICEIKQIIIPLNEKTKY